MRTRKALEKLAELTMGGKLSNEEKEAVRMAMGALREKHYEECERLEDKYFPLINEIASEYGDVRLGIRETENPRFNADYLANHATEFMDIELFEEENEEERELRIRNAIKDCIYDAQDYSAEYGNYVV